ncbi:uncharacterized protein LODBEIA_P54050 [Lodderomyces beijingensis]|uniref:Uncharacterized protein n=1 Tax=Lodderomyces beijingensis TaxID=1775926 RepID=A0ABP0ZVC7_9ASCO
MTASPTLLASSFSTGPDTSSLSVFSDGPKTRFKTVVQAMQITEDNGTWGPANDTFTVYVMGDDFSSNLPNYGPDVTVRFLPMSEMSQIKNKEDNVVYQTERLEFVLTSVNGTETWTQGAQQWLLTGEVSEMSRNVATSSGSSVVKWWAALLVVVQALWG